MKIRVLSTLAVALLVLTILALPVQSQTNQIIITGADARVDISLSSSAQLNVLTSALNPRFILQYADANKFYDLPPLAPQLAILLGNIRDRAIFQYADANNDVQLLYPAQLFGDTVPPQATNISENTTSGKITITWVTDEFSTSTVVYGVHPGVYTVVVSDPLYVKQHTITLSGLIPAEVQQGKAEGAGVAAGILFYYQVHSADRSGNTHISSEGTFQARRLVYLPLTRK
jgi:hypothetical protein